MSAPYTQDENEDDRPEDDAGWTGKDKYARQGWNAMQALAAHEAEKGDVA